MPGTLALSLMQGGVSIDCRDAAVRSWLSEMLLPAFEVIQPSRAGAAVVVRPTPRHAGRVRRDAEVLPCFALDHQVVSLPAERTGSSTLVDDADVGVSYDLGPDSVEVRPLGAAPGLRIGVFRVVRELAMVQALGSSRVQLHASGLAVGGDVVLFAGPRESGKTTTLAHLAASTGADIVANDRVLVDRCETSWEVRGVPTIVSLRPDTMARLPNLFAAQESAGRTVHLTMAEAKGAPRSPQKTGVAERLAVSLPQLAASLGVSLAAGGTLGCIALLTIDETVGSFAVRPLRAGQAMTRLEASRFGAGTEPRPTTVFEAWLAGEHAPQQARVPVCDLAQTAECVDVRVGPGLLRSEQAAKDLLHALLAAPTKPYARP